jgi:hypothetical protein
LMACGAGRETVSAKTASTDFGGQVWHRGDDALV